MHTAVLVLAVITVIMYALLAIEVTAGSRSIGRLGMGSPEDLVRPPKLSVIVAAGTRSAISNRLFDPCSGRIIPTTR